MPSLDKRLAALETAFIEHLKESGTIRADLKWLKRAFWALVSLGTLVTAGVIEEVVRHLLQR